MSDLLRHSNGDAYDVYGSRVYLFTGGVPCTNAVGAGYRMTQVKNRARATDTYAYDNGGRVGYVRPATSLATIECRATGS